MQRARRHAVSSPPFQKPYVLKAWMLYTEQEGTKRQELGSSGEICLR